ncbi:unnamed protein product, partial [marine sediment metagenome]
NAAIGAVAEDSIKLFEMMSHKIIMSMLDIINKGAQENSEKSKEASAIGTQNRRLKESIRAGVKAQDVNAEKVSEQNKGSAVEAVVLAVSIAAVGIAVTPAMVSAATMPESLLKEGGALVKAVAPTQLDQVLSTLVALYGTAIITQSTLLNLTNLMKEKNEYDESYSTSYATRTLQVVAGDKIDQAVKLLFHEDEVLGNLKTAVMKIILLTQGLAFSTKRKTGWISGREMVENIKREDKERVEDKRQEYATRDDLDPMLLNEIRKNIHLLPPKEREMLFSQMIAYYGDYDTPADQRPNLAELSDPSNAIYGMYSKVQLPVQG